MKQLIICSTGDAHHLQTIVPRITVETTLLLSSGGGDPAVLSRLATDKVTVSHHGYDPVENETRIYRDLQGLERVYFVVANAVTGSCALRAMVLALSPKLLETEC